MFWWTVLFVLTIIFTLAAIAGFAVTLIEPGFAPIFLLVLAICIGSHIGANKIEKAHTEISTEVMEMKIGEFYVTDEMGSSHSKTNYYVDLENGYLIEISLEEFHDLKQKDTVLVEVETKTTFGETTETARLFKGD